MKSPFILIDTSKSFCPECGESVTLLLHENGNGPKFYICYPCKRVFQSGKSEVRHELE